MELLDKVIDAHKNYNEFLLYSYLKQILSLYITQSAPKISRRRPLFLTNFREIAEASRCYLEGRDSLSSLESSEEEDEIYEEWPEFMNKRGALVSQPEKAFRIDVGQIDGLGSVFGELSAGQIKSLLELLEHKKGRVRKLMLVLFCVLLDRSLNKARFIDRCALGPSGGLYLISRLKVVTRDVEKSVFLYILLKQIKGYMKNLELKMRLNGVNCKGWFSCFYEAFLI